MLLVAISQNWTWIEKDDYFSLRIAISMSYPIICIWCDTGVPSDSCSIPLDRKKNTNKINNGSTRILLSTVCVCVCVCKTHTRTYRLQVVLYIGEYWPLPILWYCKWLFKCWKIGFRSEYYEHDFSSSRRCLREIGNNIWCHRLSPTSKRLREFGNLGPLHS